jgi:ABC-type multidrug transport system fused ATPase/permease subunit
MDFITFSMIFCMCKFIVSFIRFVIINNIIFNRWQNILQLIFLLFIVLTISYVFYESRQYLPGNLTNTEIDNKDPGSEFIIILCWQLYLVSYRF